MFLSDTKINEIMDRMGVLKKSIEINEECDDFKELNSFIEEYNSDEITKALFASNELTRGSFRSRFKPKNSKTELFENFNRYTHVLKEKPHKIETVPQQEPNNIQHKLGD